MGKCVPSQRIWWGGVINTKLFNKALLLKWVWRLLNCEEEDSCCQLLAEYFPSEAIICSKSRGVLCKVNCGKQTRFGEDVWIGKIPLKLAFPNLFSCCRDKN
jgi:hypothetical protein